MRVQALWSAHRQVHRSSSKVHRPLSEVHRLGGGKSSFARNSSFSSDELHRSPVIFRRGSAEIIAIVFFHQVPNCSKAANAFPSVSKWLQLPICIPKWFPSGGPSQQAVKFHFRVVRSHCKLHSQGVQWTFPSCKLHLRVVPSRQCQIAVPEWSPCSLIAFQGSSGPWPQFHFRVLSNCIPIGSEWS